MGPYHHKRILAARGISGRPGKPMRDPWLAPCGEALDESIMRVMSDGIPRTLSQFVSLVENDYGRISPTAKPKLVQLQRRFARLCAAGVAMRVEIGQRLFAYVRSDARIANDVDAIRDVITENADRPGFIERWA